MVRVRARIVVALFAGVGMLAGCAHAGGDGVDAQASEDAFLKVMHERFTNSTASDAEYVSAGKQLCDVFADAPTTKTWVLQVKALTDAGYSPENAGFVIGASVTSFCPQYASALPSS